MSSPGAAALHDKGNRTLKGEQSVSDFREPLAISPSLTSVSRISRFLRATDLPRGRPGRSARIGVDDAEDWADKPWRFFGLDNPWVSRARPSPNRPR